MFHYLLRKIQTNHYFDTLRINVVDDYDIHVVYTLYFPYLLFSEAKIIILCVIYYIWKKTI